MAEFTAEPSPDDCSVVLQYNDTTQAQSGEEQATRLALNDMFWVKSHTSHNRTTRYGVVPAKTDWCPLVLEQTSARALSWGIASLPPRALSVQPC